MLFEECSLHCWVNPKVYVLPAQYCHKKTDCLILPFCSLSISHSQSLSLSLSRSLSFSHYLIYESLYLYIFASLFLLSLSLCLVKTIKMCVCVCARARVCACEFCGRERGKDIDSKRKLDRMDMRVRIRKRWERGENEDGEKVENEDEIKVENEDEKSSMQINVAPCHE